MASLTVFDADDLTGFGEAIRAIAREVDSMEAAATRVVDLLHDELVDQSGDSELVLVRLYKTHAFGRLPSDLQAFVRGLLGHEPAAELRCLTLLATRGSELSWNDRHRSSGHQAIPLVSVERVDGLPMVSGLLRQLGVEVEDVVRPPTDRLVELSQRSYGVFHVPEAQGSEYIPDQVFVERYGIASAVGFGGVLFTGDFFACVLFARAAVSAATAERLRVLSLAVRVALLPFGNRVFA